MTETTEPSETPARSPIGRLAPVVRGFIALTTATAIGQVIGFVVLAIVARRVGPSNLGAYTFAVSFGAYFQIPIDFGITAYAIREVARRPEDVREIVGEVLAVQLALLALCAGITLAVAPALMPSADARAVLPIVVAGWIPAALSLEWAVRAVQNMRAVALWRLIGQVAYGALAPLLVGGGLAGVKTYAWLNLAGGAVGALGVSATLLRSHGWPRLHLDLRALVARYRRGAVMGISLGIALIYYTMDSLVLGYMSTDHAVGIFGVANKVPTNLVLVGTMWFQAAYPFASALGVHDRARLLRHIGAGSGVAATLALPLAIGATVLADPLMTGLFGAKYASAGTPFLVLIWSTVASLVQVHFTNAVLALGDERKHLVGVVAAGLVNLALDVALIPSLGPTGAALASLAAEFVLLGAMAGRIVRLLGRPQMNVERIVRSALAAGVMAAVLVPLRHAIPVWPALVVGVGVYAGAALAIGVARPAELRLLVRRGAAG